MSTETTPAHPGAMAAEWLAAAHGLALPDAVVDAARRALLDWFACCIGGMREPVVARVLARARAWAPWGEALLLGGGSTAPALAALVHATSAHAQDFDDTHIYTDAHFSGPTWAAVLSQLKERERNDDMAVCRAFVAGFEAGAKLGGRRLGHAMSQRGFQPTALMGRVSAAAACSVLKRLDAPRMAAALALAGAQTAGLTATFGSMAKPFQGGKAALDGVLAAELADDGFAAPVELFDTRGGIARALVQDGYAEVAIPDFAGDWEITRNSTKAYPCLHGIHPAIDAAREAGAQLRAGDDIRHVRVFVGPGVARIARYTTPRTPHEARFSLSYGVALGLLGRSAGIRDFESAVLDRPDVQALLPRIEVVPAEGRKMIDAGLEVQLAGGRVIAIEVPIARGHPGKPLTADEQHGKFMDLTEPVLGRVAAPLWSALSRFPAGGALDEAVACVRSVSLPAA